jgi:hypothetical protein
MAPKSKHLATGRDNLAKNCKKLANDHQNLAISNNLAIDTAKSVRLGQVSPMTTSAPV